MEQQLATIYSFTTIRVAAEQFQHRAPYSAAVLEGADGTRFLAFLTGDSAEGFAIGAAVRYHSQDENGKPVFVLA